MTDFSALIKLAIEQGASDVHIQAGAQPMLRIAGQIRGVSVEPYTPEEMVSIIRSIVPKHRTDGVEQAAINGLDFSYVHSPEARFRCSAYSAMNRLGIVMRMIRSKIPTIEELHLPSVISDIALSQRGLTLVTGTTGSGKSTTLAAMINLINENHHDRRPDRIHPCEQEGPDLTTGGGHRHAVV